MHLRPKYSNDEIERRWLVDLPTVNTLAFKRTRKIIDHYIQGTELRLRTVSEEGQATAYKLGKKYERKGRSQPTVSIYLSQEEQSVLVQLPAACATKYRYTLTEGVFDVYVTPAHAFAIFEVEFESEEQARNFTPPHFVAREVTGDKEYTGYALAVGHAECLGH